jgi:D-glucosaminate-6-phosphate ammonia-lyase
MSNDPVRRVPGFLNRLDRRQLFRLTGLFGLGGLVSPRVEAAPAPLAPAAPEAAASVYKTLGVRPLINCRGTLTIIGGSVELPEVRAAKMAATSSTCNSTS